MADHTGAIIAQAISSGPSAGNPALQPFILGGVIPLIVVVSPSTAAPISPNATLVFQVIGLGLTAVVVWATFAGFPQAELVYDGNQFYPPYTSLGSSVSVIDTGFQFSIRRTGGFPGAPTITAAETDNL